MSKPVGLTALGSPCLENRAPFGALFLAGLFDKARDEELDEDPDEKAYAASYGEYLLIPTLGECSG
ncbi:MAG: hypothetical protein ACRC8Q_01390 [Aeromonas sp.]